MSASEAVWNGRFGAFAMAYVLFGIGAEGLKKCVRSAASSQRNGRDGRRGGARGALLDHASCGARADIRERGVRSTPGSYGSQKAPAPRPANRADRAATAGGGPT